MAFAVVFAGLLLWSLALPLMASPDEPSHIVKAAAVARGELLGRDAREGHYVVTSVTVPAGLTEHLREPCFAGTPHPATCQHLRHADGHLESATTFAGRYPPLYYAIVGLGGWVSPGPVGMYAMRLLSAALSAAFLASALASTRQWRSRLGTTALVVAATPTTVFLAGTVNPNGLEITAAVCVWTTGLALLDRGAATTTRLVTRLGVSAGVMVLVRGLSPLLLALVAAVVLLCSAPRVVLPLLRRRDVRLMLGGVATATAAAVAFVVVAGTLAFAPSFAPSRGLSIGEALLKSFTITPFRLQQMIAYLGWLDTLPPPVTTYLWYFALGLLLLLSLATGTTRHRLALAAAVIVTLALPLLEAPSAATEGLIWQGRYTLPFAVGLPLLAAWSCRLPRGEETTSLVRALERWTIGLLMVGQLLVFVWTLRRFVVGRNASFVGLLHPDWNPPLPVWLLVFAYAVTLAVTWRLLVRVPDDQPEPAVAATAIA